MMESPFRIGMGYQENYLTVKHIELGYDVHAISTSDGITFPKENKGSFPIEHITKEGLHIHYLETNNSILRKIPFIVGWIHITKGLFKKLTQVKPDIIFVHGICKIDNIEVVKYCKVHPEVELFVDNHSDYYNTPVNTLREKSFKYTVGRYIGKKFNTYAKRIWGVSPWRVTYQQEVYSITPDKSGLLVMGGDEKAIKWEQREEVRIELRQKLEIPDSAFVVITGGKIDKTKNIHLLIDAITGDTTSNVHLIIFGRFEKDMKEYAEALTDKRIHNVGWITPNEANDYFLASDLACFPGTHSVLWEQACACGLPAIFKDWDGGFSHVDVGGNCILLKEISIESLYSTINRLVNNKEDYEKMKEVAQTKARKIFSYIEIAKRSIGIV